MKTVLTTLAIASTLSLITAANAEIVLMEDFNSGIPMSWSVADDVPTGPSWGINGGPNNETGNYTGGTGTAASVSSDKFGAADFATSLVTPTFSLVGFVDATLDYLVNYQNFAFLDFLDVDISTDMGANWINLLSWNEDHGGFGAAPGEAVSLDLSGYLGADTLNIRWRYYDPNTFDFDWYAQVDDVVIEGTRIAVSEPASLALFGLPLFAFYRRSRR